jgi:fucose permease
LTTPVPHCSGALLLLLRKRLALPVFWVSLVAVLILFGYCLFPGRMIEVLGAAQALPMPILVTAIAAFLVWFASRSITRGWIG